MSSTSSHLIIRVVKIIQNPLRLLQMGLKLIRFQNKRYHPD